MAHFAQLDDNNIVTQVIVVDNRELIDPHTGEEDEILGVAFCKRLFGGKWKQTSYNNNIRVRFAAVGFSYNEELDAFIPPQPYPSWTLDTETTNWISPLGDYPSLENYPPGSYYKWDEENTTWNLVTPE